ncbi:hypothetical protein MIR68_000947 [Amoeboaphelidium protococcarum]|nr:hypothetical protein MIR68_000947 [Amoeboaphelidium protococcarum]
MVQSYNDRTVDFVSNNAGSSLELVLLLSIMPLSSYVLVETMGIRSLSLQSLFYTLIMILLVGRHLLYGILACIMFILIAAVLKLITTFRYSDTQLDSRKIDFNIRTSVSVFKVLMMVMTVFSILAVDFQYFKRVHCKVEQYGISLMDIGVGSFVFSMGLTAVKPIQQRSWQQVLSKIMITAGMGIVRLLMVKGSGYHEHETEYGRHWNFFFTLSAVQLWSFTLSASIGNTYVLIRLILGVIVTGAHQYGLSKGLESYAFATVDRSVSLIAANKEGIISLPGYFAICEFGCALGIYLNSRHQQLQDIEEQLVHEKDNASRCDILRSRQMRIVWNVMSWLITLCVTMIATYILALKNQSRFPFSRRSCNGMYIYATVIVNCCVVSLTMLSTTFIGKSISQSPLVTGLSKHTLMMFLVANVMTGIINKSIQTIDASDVTFVLVITIYMIMNFNVGNMYDMIKNVKHKSD